MRSSSWIRAGGAATTLLLVSGCTTLQLPPYQPLPIEQYRTLQVRRGLAVAIHPLVDKAESERHFGFDLLSSNILAVLVVGENRDASASFVLTREAILLHLAAPVSPESREALKSEGAGEAVAMTGAILVSPILLLAGAKLTSDASVINHAIKAQEFQTRTLSPGQRATGVVYFRLPEKSGLPDHWSIQVEATQASLEHPDPVRFTFTQEAIRR